MDEVYAFGVGRWIPVVARVEWHSAGQARSTPVRVWFGGEWLPVVVKERAHLGPARAGDPTFEQFVVEDSRRRVFRIRAGAGVVMVETLAPA